MIVGDLTAGARNHIEKAPSRYYTSASPNIPQKFKDQYFCQMTREARRGARGEPPGHQVPPGRGLPLGRAWGPLGGPGSPPAPPFDAYHPFDLKITGGASKKYSVAASRAETRERKALRQGEIYRGNSFPEGQIVAIVIVIATGFIGIIINIILTDITIIPIAPLCSAITCRVILVVVHWDHFSGVDCLV